MGADLALADQGAAGRVQEFDGFAFLTGKDKNISISQESSWHFATIEVNREIPLSLHDCNASQGIWYCFDNSLQYFLQETCLGQLL
ncbi:hypothetical protein MKD49_05635 [Herbaspirillum sp. WGmk3]|uniref:hypothetical protein n=1 Tax=Herbaspirillum sp. WGmk3 TaxID=2919925 RepID=UPI0020910306|nr:hypothetical protein [Herbaspirillum sp. WGmk3]MCO4855962.1 hypothetical protein [Herbaspirillum sp. WGmk3]